MRAATRAPAVEAARKSTLALLLGCFFIASLLSHEGSARAAAERTLVRYYTPETGGPQAPRFITERTLAFFARMEAQAERNPNVYDERYVRAAMERYVAEDMLSELVIRRGSEPQDLPKLVQDARADLCDRLGGCGQLQDALAREGMTEAELANHLRRKVRAAAYVDRAITPIFHPAEDEVYEAYRTSLHPYRGLSFNECKAPLARWLTYEKLRLSELEYLQSARARVRIVSLFVKPEAQ
jgi:hypothetical protein